MPKHIKISESIIRAHEERHKGLLLSEIAEIFIREIKRMSPKEKAELRKHLDQQNRCRRSNGTLRAWFATATEAVAFAENPRNAAYHAEGFAPGQRGLAASSGEKRSRRRKTPRCKAVQARAIGWKNVAFCSTDVNSTIGWAYYRGGGEGGIRTHGRVSPTHAFQACSLNRSDTSPRKEAQTD